MDKLKHFLNENNVIRTKKNYDYDYDYYLCVDDVIVLNKKSNTKYGSSRDGYERWKRENQTSQVGYAGDISAREIIDRNTKKTQGYIFEKKRFSTEYQEKQDEIFDCAWKYFCELFEIKDEKAIEFFILQDVELAWTQSEQTGFKIRALIEAYTNYNEDELYRYVFDKIKGC